MFGCVGCVFICGSYDLEGDAVDSSHCCVLLKTGTSALRCDAWWEWCRCMACSQSLRKGEKRASCKVIGSYVIRATGQLLLSCGLLNTSGFDMQTSTSYFFMVACQLRRKGRLTNCIFWPTRWPWANVQPQYDPHQQDHRTCIILPVGCFWFNSNGCWKINVP